MFPTEIWIIGSENSFLTVLVVSLIRFRPVRIGNGGPTGEEIHKIAFLDQDKIVPGSGGNQRAAYYLPKMS